MKTNKPLITTFDDFLEKQFGKVGTKKRTEFEISAKAFVIGEIIKEERRLMKITQKELAEKTGTKSSYISRVENGRCDIQLSTLYRLFEVGLNKKVSISFN